MIASLRLRAHLALLLSTFALTWARRFDRWAGAATDRASAFTAQAQVLADRLERIRRAAAPQPAGDLLHGSRAIAAYLGVPKGVAAHLIRSGAIPWFALAGVACARRSTLVAHFADLEARGRAAAGEHASP